MRRILLAVAITAMVAGVVVVPGAMAAKPLPPSITAVSISGLAPSAGRCPVSVTVTYSGKAKHGTTVIASLDPAGGGQNFALGASPFTFTDNLWTPSALTADTYYYEVEIQNAKGAVIDSVDTSSFVLSGGTCFPLGQFSSY